MKFNRPIAAAALGALATLAGELLSLAFVWAGVVETDSYRIDSLLITFNEQCLFLGFVANFITGGAIAVLLNWALSRYGADWVVSKAIAATLAGWFLLRLYATAFLESQGAIAPPLAQYYVHLAGAVATGVALGLLLKGLLHRGGAERQRSHAK